LDWIETGGSAGAGPPIFFAFSGVVEWRFCWGFWGCFGFPPWFAAGRFVVIDVVRLEREQAHFVAAKKCAYF
jgi:hypothetical protein